MQAPVVHPGIALAADEGPARDVRGASGRLRLCRPAIGLMLLLVFGAVPTYASAAETLREAVAAAVGRFPEIRVAEHRREAARAQVDQARAELFPVISGSFGSGRESSRNLTTRLVGNDVTLTRQEAELNLSQLVFDGGAAGGQVKRFAARAEGAGYTVINTVEDVALRAGQAFVDVGRLRQQLAIARDNIGVHQKTLEDVNALAEAGRGRRADVVQAEARRALATSLAEQLAGQLAQAEDAFRHLDRPSTRCARRAGLAGRAVAAAVGGRGHAGARGPSDRQGRREGDRSGTV